MPDRAAVGYVHPDPVDEDDAIFLHALRNEHYAATAYLGDDGLHHARCATCGWDSVTWADRA